MELPLLLLALATLCLASVPAHTVESHAETYWKAKLGNTPMPKVLLNRLEGVKGEIENANLTNKYNISKYVTYLLFEKAIKNSSNESNNREDGESVATTYGKLSNIWDFPEFYGESDATAYVKLIQHNGLDVFFLEKSFIYPGGKSKLFFESDIENKFLPLQVAKSIPFSSSKLQEILNILSIKPTSSSAKEIEETLKVCEAKPLEGENKYCTTSLETLVDYVISNIGSKVKAFSTTIDKDTIMVYKFEKVRKISNNVNLVCHRKNYPYAVFYCHNFKSTDSYVVSLIDINGKKSKAVAVCHKDTSSWNPGHLAFRLLKIKPGSMHICHFLNAGSIVWAPA